MPGWVLVPHIYSLKTFLIDPVNVSPNIMLTLIHEHLQFIKIVYRWQYCAEVQYKQVWRCWNYRKFELKYPISRSLLKLQKSRRQVTDDYRRVQTNTDKSQTSTGESQTTADESQASRRRLQSSHKRVQTNLRQIQLQDELHWCIFSC